MNGTAAGAFRSTVPAAGFVLDVPLIGTAEAAERVLALWRDGAALWLLPHGAWLLRLPAHVEVRADRAPGLPLLAHDGGLTAVGADATARAGEAVLLLGGVLQRYRLDELTAVDPADWLDLSGVAVSRLRPLEAPVAPEPVLDEVPVPPRPDLRAAAGLRPGSRRVALRPARPARRARNVPGGLSATSRLALLTFGACLLLIRSANAAFGAGARPGELLRGGIIVLGAALLATGGIVARLRRAHPAGEPGGRRRPSRTARLGGLLSRLVLRTPVAPVLRGRHARYLRRLTTAFERRRWEDALRDAVSLAPASPADDRRRLLGIRLPRRRTGALRPTPQLAAADAALPADSAVRRHLTELYRRAAMELEREGRIEEAAFVLADLLDVSVEAVAVLERHGRLRAAAELAEGRGLPSDLVVRLWWQAGERARALRTAQTRGAFAGALERLAEVDRDGARALREAWVRSCQDAGDRLGAVEAAWPEESLRPLIAGDLRDCVALGGTTRAGALAHLLALGAGPATRTLALATLDSREPHHRAQRERLATTLARIPAAEPAADRELATAAARAVVRDRGFGRSVDDGTQRRLFTGLLHRADPLVAADLRAPGPRRTRPGRPLDVTAARQPGRLPVFDAALLDSGSVLVACGDAGVRLLAPDGRTRARWDVPAHRLVLADHGAAAMLVARYGQVCEIARLDLATRSVRPWTALRVREVLPSFDGRMLITVDEDGIAVLDTLASRPAVVWRELDREARVLGRMARTPTGCSAVVASGELVERWRWDLPGWQLRSRLAVRPEEVGALLASGGMLQLLPAPATGGLLLRRHGEEPDTERLLGGVTAVGLATDGDLHAIAVTSADGAVRLEAGTGRSPEPTVRVTFPGPASAASTGIRRHGGTATFWHRDGRVVATTDGGAVSANLRVTVS